MRRRILRYAYPVITLVLVGLAAHVLYRELGGVHYHQVLQHLRDMPPSRLYLALLLTVVSYILLTGYDTLSVRYVGETLPYKKISLASFVGYTLSYNLGISEVSGSAVRFRLYSAWGLSAYDIARIVAFNGLTFLVGLLSLSGVVFIAWPVELPGIIHLPPLHSTLLGLLLFVPLLAYIALSLFRRKPLRIGKWSTDIPPLRYVLTQVGLAATDIAAASMVAYVLMPPSTSLTFPHFIGIYVLAIVASLISHVPGGIGVFETVIITLIPDDMNKAAVLGSLLMYRVVYYLIPLGIAILLLGWEELTVARRHVERVVRDAQRWLEMIAPRLLAASTFVGGVILLVSGVTPAIPERLELLRELIPLPALEFSHFAGSLIGVILLFLANGLARRLDAAYVLTGVFLGLGIAVSLIKGLDYEEAIALSVMLLVLLPSHRFFYRETRLSRLWYSPASIVAILIAVAGSLWLGFFAFRHVEYSNELWWQFTLKGDAPRFLRAAVGSSVLVVILLLGRVLRPLRPSRAPAGVEAIEQASAIAHQAKHTAAFLALLGDKKFLFSESGNTFMMYGVEGGSFIAHGGPYGDPAEFRELIWNFRELAERHGSWPVIYLIPPETLELYIEQGLSMVKLGEEAIIPLDNFSLEGKRFKTIRYTVRKVEKDGGSFAILQPDEVAEHMEELRAVSDAWLEQKNTREKRFSLGNFREDYIRRLPVAVVRQEGRIVAFANLWPGDDRHEVSVDLMRYGPDAPSGVMDYLFVEIMLWARDQGYQQFNMGMAPLSGLSNRPQTPLWNRVGSYIFEHGEYFYNFQGLRSYKDKFDPRWEPRYLVSPGGLVLPQVLVNLATIVSGGASGIFFE